MCIHVHVYIYILSKLINWNCTWTRKCMKNPPLPLHKEWVNNKLTVSRKECDLIVILLI